MDIKKEEIPVLPMPENVNGAVFQEYINEERRRIYWHLLRNPKLTLDSPEIQLMTQQLRASALDLYWAKLKRNEALDRRNESTMLGRPDTSEGDTAETNII
jgi:hypothetical protein